MIGCVKVQQTGWPGGDKGKLSVHSVWTGGTVEGIQDNLLEASQMT